MVRKRGYKMEARMPNTYKMSIVEIRRRLAFLLASPRIASKPRNRAKIHAYKMEVAYVEGRL
jgi:hypothetical protein